MSLIAHSPRSRRVEKHLPNPTQSSPEGVPTAMPAASPGRIPGQTPGLLPGLALALRLVSLCALVFFSACTPQPDQGALSADVQAAIQAEIETALELEEIPQIGIVVTDREGNLWAAAYGHHDLAGEFPARDDSLYRVGSVSKLFTDLAIMKLVERGDLDLDAPVSDVLTSFKPESDFDEAITLRQLMSHRSGLLREPPVGHYFDDTVPTLEQTVDSLNQTALVAAPGSLSKYSNAGIAVVGRVLETATQQPFEAAVTDLVLRPLAMTSSSFSTPVATERVPDAAMWTSFGREFLAPTFDLGMAPAGSLYTSLEDLGVFMRALMKPDAIVQPATFQEMLTPQFAEPGPDGEPARSGFGLGFAVDELDGERRIGHGGAIYGFATQLAVLPERGFGVAVVATKDFGNSVASRIAEATLQQLLSSETPPPPPEALLSESEIDRLAGTYMLDGRLIEIKRRGDRLWVHGGRYPAELRHRPSEDGSSAGRLVLSGLTGPDDDFLPSEGTPSPSFQVGDRTFERASPEPTEAPDGWQDYIGEYGWDHNVLVILERQGKLHALIEWFELNPLEEVNQDVFAFPEGGSWLYHHENLSFIRDANGNVIAAKVGEVRFDRRQIGAVDGATFKIAPVRPITELRSEAAAASPPEEEGEFRDSDLVEIADVVPGVKLDVRYATTNNFMGAAFYAQPRAFLQRPAADALARVQASLAKRGFGLLVHDAYRPWSVTKMFWDATPEEQKVFVANPANGSRHNRGSAVDLTLISLNTGLPVPMTGGYDEFSDRSYPDYPGGTSTQRYSRELLRREMESEGFTVYEAEWWHFDHGDWRSYRIQNDAFEDLD